MFCIIIYLLFDSCVCLFVYVIHGLYICVCICILIFQFKFTYMCIIVCIASYCIWFIRIFIFIWIFKLTLTFIIILTCAKACLLIVYLCIYVFMLLNNYRFVFELRIHWLICLCHYSFNSWFIHMYFNNTKWILRRVMAQERQTDF